MDDSGAPIRPAEGVNAELGLLSWKRLPLLLHGSIGHSRMHESCLPAQAALVDAFCDGFALAIVDSGTRLDQRASVLAHTATFCYVLHLSRLHHSVAQMFPNLTIKVSEYHTNDGR
jgi:hypothetical protein